MSKPGLFIRRLGEAAASGRLLAPEGREGRIVGRQVVHFEVIGTDPAGLRRYYAALFGWGFRVGDAVSEKVSQPGAYGFVDGSAAGGGTGINGGIGGGPGRARRVLFYVGVPSVEAALGTAESLGGARLMGPEPAAGEFAIGHLADPEGNVIGVAGPPR
jgi:predicted enzyme related to lactoylglutathione lyase